MNKELSSKQFDFEKWANQLVFEAIEKADEPDPRVFELITHIIVSQHIWLKKILNDNPSYKSWEVLSIEKLKVLNEQNHSEWLAYLNGQRGDETEVYLNFNLFGTASKISVEDLIVHLINHSSYHRGQIISKLKGSIDPLPLITYIAFAAEKTELK
jgi:uncharacterized damage-inducible protein DinB